MQSRTQVTQAKPAKTLRQFFDRMLEQLGPQDWWPARTRLEIILGAILVQNTAWRNAALAIKRLREEGLLNLARLRKVSQVRLERLVRPAGFFRQKARTIRNFLAWLDGTCDGSLTGMFALPADELRGHLLKITGLGPETTDAILLYAGQQPFFVADNYTRRILTRHQLVHPRAGYSDVQRFLHQHLPADPGLFNEYHALLVEVGKQYCRRQAPDCGECPLEGFLEPHQPIALPESVKRPA